eukprot:TRINITY_DN10526_c0_g1_i1.p1 TRINITY_DN10526_c0_g1~~TRINITY_DN10526_c0_g1_i1.p1  ORF type:complete len:136 (+),score=18.86 TRINITY_DN10526_c0_g1_i1:166-573(+)
MLPFCGYNMGDYFGHWIHFGRKLGYNSPKIFYVNWFRRDEKGHFIWPGFGENSRVLKWVCQRLGSNPTAKSVVTPIGQVPALESFDTSGLDDAVTPRSCSNCSVSMERSGSRRPRGCGSTTASSVSVCQLCCWTS